MRKVTTGVNSVIKEEDECEKFGNFDQIFPFNKLSSNLAVSLNQVSSSKSPTMPNYTKMLVTEIKNHEKKRKEHLQFVAENTKS
jgi:hypothetical protein